MYKHLFLTSTLLLGTPAYSATQGDLDPTSTGSFDVSIVIPERVRLTGLRDISFGKYPGSGDLNRNLDLCVYSNAPTAGYTVVATGSGASNDFLLEESEHAIPYRVYWNDEVGTSGETQLVASTALPSQTGANAVSEDCSVGGLSANVHIEVLEADIKGNPNAVYSGVLTLVVGAS